jgi:Zn ribbon nucleic-acid-binding protein
VTLDELKRENEILKDALCLEQDRLSFARYHLQNAQDRIKRLEEAGVELRECASQLGWTSSDDSRWIKRAESAVKAWDKEAKL